MPALLDELKAVYGRTRLFRRLTTDAGNTSLRVASETARLGYSAERPSWSDVMQHFFLRLCDGILETKAFDTV